MSDNEWGDCNDCNHQNHVDWRGKKCMSCDPLAGDNLFEPKVQVVSNQVSMHHGANHKPDISNPKDGIGSMKAPISCIPMPILFEMGLAMLEGTKYGRHNYRGAGVRCSVYIDAACRHLMCFYEGEDTDPDSGLPHLAKAMACCAIIRDSQLMGNWEDDRPPRLPNGLDMPRLNALAAQLQARLEGKTLPPWTQLRIDEEEKALSEQSGDMLDRMDMMEKISEEQKQKSIKENEEARALLEKILGPWPEPKTMPGMMPAEIPNSKDELAYLKHKEKRISYLRKLARAVSMESRKRTDPTFFPSSFLVYESGNSYCLVDGNKTVVQVGNGPKIFRFLAEQYKSYTGDTYDG